MKNLTWQNPEQLFVAQELINKVKSKCCGIKVYVFPAKGWMLSVKNELFHTNDKSIGINHFLDLAIAYKAKRWEFSVTANNLIGTSEFERRTLGNTIESYSVTRLRPREFLTKWSVDL